MKTRSAWLALTVAVVISNLGRADITNGLVHHWAFDETSGFLAADSAGSNDATLFNWGLSEARWVPGRVGNALDFGTDWHAANDNYVLTDDPITYNQYTVSFFLYTRDDPHNIGPRLATPLDGYNGWILINRESEKGVGFWVDRGATKAQDPHPPKIGTWEHYAVTLDLDSGFATIYRDGSPTARAEVPSQVRRRPLLPWVFGHHDDLTNHDRGSFSGMMDDIRIYNRILQPDEMIVLSLIPTSGNFNGDGKLDALDLDLLTREVVAGTNGVEFDVNSDGLVNQTDRLVWIQERKHTWIGDSNLDGVFNTADLVSVFIDGEYEDAKSLNSGWATGDWNGDLEFTTDDLVFSFQDGGYEQGLRTSVSAVPEPAGLLLFAWTGVLLVHRRRAS